MKLFARYAQFFVLSLFLSLAPHLHADETRHPTAAAVASAHPLATEAGLEILEAGGNAFDAAVAVSAALAVVEPRGSGVGGGGFYLLHRAKDGGQVFVDAREVAPAASTPTMFLNEKGDPVPGKSLDTALAAGIPGEPAAWAHLALQYGRLPLKQSLAPAIRLARDGFPMYPRMVEDIERKKEALKRTPDGQRIFLLKGAAPAVGTLFKQKDLAKTLQILANEGASGFYQGPFADVLVAGMRKIGGNWTRKDLEDYQLIERKPLVGEYRGVRIVTAPPPSAGGVTLLDTLNILSGYDLGKLDSTTRKHLIIESLRRAHRDRAQYMGDPAFVSIPLDRLINPLYAAGQRASIRLDKATPSDMLPSYVGEVVSSSPSPAKAGEGQGGGGFQTTHFSVLDKEGNRVAATITLNALMGSGLVIPGTGILLNNEMDDFAAKAGVPNLYGLVGSTANAIAPGKRPLSSMSPTFLESDKGLVILGSPGGSYIPTMVLLGTLNWMDGADATAIVTAPRIHHQYQPDAVFFEEKALTDEERSGLAARGHQFKAWPQTIGNMQVITWEYGSGKVGAASDPRGVGAGIAR